MFILISIDHTIGKEIIINVYAYNLVTNWQSALANSCQGSCQRCSYGMASLHMILFIITLSMAHGSDLCPANCQCNDEYLRAICAYANLDVVPIQLNPEIHHLDLSNNRIISLHLAFGFYDNLESLDLSSNVIHTLGSENFNLQKKLLKLNISNNSVRNVTRKSLKGLVSLINLDLSDNNITELEEQTFHYTKQLAYLNLSGNSLTSLSDGLFNKLPSLITLDLSRNSLLEMPSNNLQMIPTLFELNLANNLIETVPDKSLDSLESLKYLNIGYNLIKEIADAAFKRLKNLESLNLEENCLTTVPTLALSNLNSLTRLVLSKNPLRVLQDQAFHNLYELKELDLRDCKISSMNSRTFSDNVRLEKILLDDNSELTDLPPKLLYGNYKNLRTVSLRYCQMTTLQPTQLPIDYLTTLKIGGNPFVCNCSIQWLWNVFKTEEGKNSTHLFIDSDDVTCNDDEFNGKLLKTLPDGSLRCRMSPLYLTLSAIGCLIATCAILGLIAYVTRTKRHKRPPYTSPNRPELLVYVEPSTQISGNKNQTKLIETNDDNFYDLPNNKANINVNTFYEPPYCNRSDNPTNNGIEGIYAFADVTDLRDTPPEVLSLYRMHSPKSSRTRQHLQQIRTTDHNYDYEYQPPLPQQKPHIVFV